ncbi:hypothetical protein PLEI_1456 [Photobacterium leiognathi lrivu.4.1]|uniref:Uncharacterized protein n=1 Tax=Photobacterium leiognathi lrivu.4.1 TaxID=1248232 RepID=A0A0U1P5P5_PHOLE|nr:hypothetical protein [Photobacterium leiognathi]GAD29803.1 hypothetical protein PLEI_1456 [Photobacterium leiognathi lrivu.4.1]
MSPLLTTLLLDVAMESRAKSTMSFFNVSEDTETFIIAEAYNVYETLQNSGEMVSFGLCLDQVLRCIESEYGITNFDIIYSAQKAIISTIDVETVKSALLYIHGERR